MTEIALAPGEYTTNRFTRMSVRKLEETNYAMCRAVWLITTGRSGTQWLANLLNNFEALHAVHEPFPSLFGWNRKRAEGHGNCADVVRAVRSDLVENAYGRGMTYVDCSPFLSHLVDDVAEAFSASRFIHISRDPRAFVCSAAPRSWYRLPTTQDHWWPRNYPADSSNVERLLWWWNEVHSRGLEAEEKHTVFRLRAEDMWSDVDAVRGLLEWLQLPETLTERAHAVIAAAQNSPRNTAKAKQITRTEWSPEWDSFLYATCGETMEALGYE